MPTDVTAWVIAIEKYEGAELVLKQPVALWALDFADLMLSRGARSVVLSTSLNDQPLYAARLAALEQQGVVRTGADQADIQNALDKIRGDGALLMYWVGHGIMQPSRQLLCADSRKATDLRAVSADSLLKRMRAPEYPRLQMGFFECCAQVVTTPPATLDFGGEGKAPTRQFFYYAASAGETASGSTQKDGFSNAILQSLKAESTFPPEPQKLFDGIKDRLKTLSLQTRPFRLQHTEESGDEWSSEDFSESRELREAAKTAGLTRSQFDRLWRNMRTGVVPPASLARAYKDGGLPAMIAGLRTNNPEDHAADDLERAANQLNLQRDFEPLCLDLRLGWQDWLAIYTRVAAEDSTARQAGTDDLPWLMLCLLDQTGQENGLRSFIKLLVLAGRRARKDYPAEAEALYQAIARNAQLQSLYASVLEKLPAERELLYLLLGITWEPNDLKASLMKAWIFPSASGSFEQQKVEAEGKLADQVNSVVQRVLEEFPDRSVAIELLLPNELMSTPRELLEVIDPDIETCTWLEAEHPVTLRWHDRMQGRYDPGNLAQRFDLIRGKAGSAASLTCEWRPETSVAGNNWNLVGLTFPGPCPAQPRRNIPKFFTELKKGEPYMCWPRRELTDVDAFKNAAAELFKGISLKGLPSALRDGRSNPALEDLMILLDEPNRNPYKGPKLVENGATRSGMSDWIIFSGTADAVPQTTDFPSPPPWRVPGAERARVLASTFRPHPDLIDAVNASIYLRRPLLITGKPGSGKSSLIHAVARELVLGSVLTWPINSRSTLREALYTYDALGRLQHIQERQASAGTPLMANIDSVASFITLGPLGTALASVGRPRALLVDEIDKSDVDLPNDLLNVLDTGNFEIPELRRQGPAEVSVMNAEGQPVSVLGGKVTFSEFPFVVMTSNGERDFPAPFLRRCVQFELPEPNEEELRRIVLAHFRALPSGDPDLAKTDGLLAKFIKKRSELPLSTDQLLNAFHVTRSSGVTFSEEEKDALLKTLFQKLG